MRHLVHTLREKARFKRPFVAGVSGIDGSGKGHVGRLLDEGLRERGCRSHLIGIDGWLQPPSLRFSEIDPARHFYERAFRFDEMQRQLFDPLSATGSLSLKALHSAPDLREEMTEHHYHIQDAEVILFEGIFLFQPRFAFDYRIWVECSFETALERALARNQEGQPPEAIRADYERIYHAAQRLHLAQDEPRRRCDFIYLNDERIRDSWP